MQFVEYIHGSIRVSILDENNKKSLLYAIKEMVDKLGHTMREVRTSADALSHVQNLKRQAN